MKQVAVLTGTRAEYGLLRPIMDEIQASSKLELSVIVTGMHLSPRHGNTIEEIKNDGFDVDHRVQMLLDSDSLSALAQSTGIAMSGLAQKLEAIDPDCLLVLGDRSEAFAGAVSAAMMNIPVGHISGGSVRGGGMIDESIRHAITRFAHIHFVQTKKDAKVLREVGEHPNRIYLTGAPALDEITTGQFADGQAVISSLGLDPNDPTIVVVQHPVTADADSSGEQMYATLRAVESIEEQAVIIHPNSDPGREDIMDKIKQYSKEYDHIVDVPNLPREEYLGLLSEADVLVGNSSSGIIEAPCFGLPVVDIGTRQGERPRHELITDVSYESDKIETAICKALSIDQLQEVDCSRSPYYHGGASRQVVDAIESIGSNEDLLSKKLNDIVK